LFSISLLAIGVTAEENAQDGIKLDFPLRQINTTFKENGLPALQVLGPYAMLRSIVRNDTFC
ncbi:MAG: hypothetical protein AAF655_16050, partial [Bacteroidota bacterium]